MMDNSPSKIAEIIIQGSTMGITDMKKHMNEYQGVNYNVMELAEKHVETEQANIEEMKGFL